MKDSNLLLIDNEITPRMDLERTAWTFNNRQFLYLLLNFNTVCIKSQHSIIGLKIYDKIKYKKSKYLNA